MNTLPHSPKAMALCAPPGESAQNLATVDQALARLAGMEAARQAWMSAWAELAAQIMPRKSPRPGASAQANDEAIFDSTATHALELLASGLGGLLTNPALPWFDLRLRDHGADLDQEAREFLTRCRDRMLAAFNSDGTGFQAAAHELYLDLCLFGTGVLYVEADDEVGVRFSARPLGEVYAAENARGIVDTVLRKYEITARQAWQEWGEACSPALRRLLEDRPEERVEILHAVYPRQDRNPASPASRDFPFACVYLECATRHLLEESGYVEMPYMVPRWAKTSGEAYGRGPGLTALSDVRVLNAMSRTALMAAEKMSDPPLMVPDDGFLGPIHSGPGGLSYYRAGSSDRIEALPVRVDLAAVEGMIQRRRESVRAIFLADQLAPEAVQTTATESLIRQANKMRILGPVLGRLQTELLAPLIERVFNLLLRGGDLPPWPKSLPEDALRIEYASPIARAQRLAETQNLGQTAQYLAPLLLPGDPFRVLDNFNPDAITRHAAELFGLPANYLRAAEEVDRLRAARQG